MFNYVEHYNKLLFISISGASELTVTQVKMVHYEDIP